MRLQHQRLCIFKNLFNVPGTRDFYELELSRKANPILHVRRNSSEKSLKSVQNSPVRRRPFSMLKKSSLSDDRWKLIRKAAPPPSSHMKVLFYMDEIDKQLKFYHFWRTKIINFIEIIFLNTNQNLKHKIVITFSKINRKNTRNKLSCI